MNQQQKDALKEELITAFADSETDEILELIAEILEEGGRDHLKLSEGRCYQESYRIIAADYMREAIYVRKVVEELRS